MNLVRDVVYAVSMVSAMDSFFRSTSRYSLCRELGSGIMM